MSYKMDDLRVGTTNYKKWKSILNPKDSSKQEFPPLNKMMNESMIS